MIRCFLVVLAVLVLAAPRGASANSLTESDIVLRPVLENGGVVLNDPSDGTYWALFGYKNDTIVGGSNIAVDLTAWPGITNKFTGSILGTYENVGGLIGDSLGSTGPITAFDPGRVFGAFWANFAGGNLVWTLDGRTATAGAGTAQGTAQFVPTPTAAIAGLAMLGGVVLRRRQTA